MAYLGRFVCILGDGIGCPLEEVKRGKWIKVEPFINLITCSECGHKHYAHIDALHFCSKCGADMRGNKE